MSGPKISIYDLSPLARRNLNSQIRCDRDALACSDRIEAFLREATSYRLQIEKLISSSDLMLSRGIDLPMSKEDLQQLLNRMCEESETIQKAMDADKPVITGKYEISEEALTKKKADLEKLRSLKKEAESLRNDLDKAVYQGEMIRSEAMSKVKDSIAEDLTGYYSFDDISLAADSEDISSLIREAEEKLILIKNAEEMPAQLGLEIDNAFSALKRIKTKDSIRLFNSVTIKNIESHVSKYKAEMAAHKERFRDALSRYQVLCTMLGMEPVKYSYSEASLVSLEDEIEALELAAIKQQEQQYICECVDQVMSDMGYELIGARNVSKKNGKRFRNELYTFDEGTAVNVTYSSEGQIAMELGGISHDDRVPTVEETQVLTENMTTFCSEFSEFEQRLRAKGVILGHRIAMSPPSADYATIINVSDYNIIEGKQFSEIGVSQKKKAKNTEKKTLRRDE